MMHGNRIRCHRTPGINEQGASLLGHLPQTVIAQNDVLPADLADTVRAIAAGLQIDDANSGERIIGDPDRSFY
jgi:hypothetical protein